ncbi:MAG: lysyl-tRNA synthetase [Verrucomicrobiota bacterium]
MLGGRCRIVFHVRRMSMDDTNSLIEQRKAKLAALNAKGLNPFMNKFTPDTECGVARAKFEAGKFTEGTPVAVAGRITAHRDMGKSQFMDLKDTSGRVQIYAQKNVLGDAQYDIFKHLDMGDFIGVKGTMFRTKTGEPSVKVDSFVIVGKALRPPPTGWHGLEDTEIRYRQRYLDLIASDDVRKTFLNRSAIIHEIRSFFHSRGYVEVETPAMQAIPGGAAAAPFKTFHNALGCEFYLRIALELYHKRLLVGGINKLFEIGKNFRNEGLSRRHNPEFTMLEAYQAFGDYETMMETVQSLICHCAQKVLGTLVIHHNQDVAVKTAIHIALKELDEVSTNMTGNLLKSADGDTAAAFVKDIANARAALVAAQEQIGKAPCDQVAKAAIGALLTAIGTVGLNKVKLSGGDKPVEESLAAAAGKFDSVVRSLEKLSSPKVIDLTPNWRRARYKDLVREVAGKDWFDITPEERRRRAMEDLKLAGDIAKGYEDFEVTGAVFEKLVEPTLIQPTFVTHLPKELVPLAKLSPDDPTTVEVFECCINGQEISPGYTEQNDPVTQRTTLEHQAGGEQQKLDDDFLVALEHGMPPAGGIGIGIDRLCMMLLGQESIRDVILFPQMKPRV